jgi:hypothetical protein
MNEKLGKKEIATLLNVPEKLVGIGKGTLSLSKVFWDKVIMPYIKTKGEIMDNST